jgi:hypothetical protein
MNESKHTPGPWSAHATGLCRSGLPEHEIHWSSDGECVCEIVHGEAEAHLISAAPDMLEVIFNVCALGDGMDSETWPEVLEMARKALDKAEGRE